MIKAGNWELRSNHDVFNSVQKCNNSSFAFPLLEIYITMYEISPIWLNTLQRIFYSVVQIKLTSICPFLFHFISLWSTYQTPKRCVYMIC
jgi:hypothetical protein